MALGCLFGHNWELEEKNYKGTMTSSWTKFDMGYWIGDIYRCKRCLESKKVIKERHFDEPYSEFYD